MGYYFHVLQFSKSSVIVILIKLLLEHPFNTINVEKSYNKTVFFFYIKVLCVYITNTHLIAEILKYIPVQLRCNSGTLNHTTAFCVA